jgi:hypothetical protein
MFKWFRWAKTQNKFEFSIDSTSVNEDSEKEFKFSGMSCSLHEEFNADELITRMRGAHIPVDSVEKKRFKKTFIGGSNSSYLENYSYQIRISPRKLVWEGTYNSSDLENFFDTDIYKMLHDYSVVNLG